MAKENIFQLALMILNDQCPPDNRMYICNFGEDPDCDCTMCWDRYLWWAQNGYCGDPYEFDRRRYEKQKPMCKGGKKLWTEPKRF